MTVGKISLTCWIIFGVMCLAFLPVGVGVMAIHALPGTIRVVLAIVVVLGLWWGPFAYAMYLSMAVVRNGDRRLLKRGIAGTAEVLSAKATNEVIQEGEFAWEAPRVYKYRLRVAIPDRSPYETDCRICASGIRQGSTVRVAVSPHNHKRVTIDIGQGSKSSKKGTATADVPGLMTAGDVRARLFPAGTVDSSTVDSSPEVEDMTGQDDQLSANSERIDQLARLGQLHSQGVLTDAEFAAEKAKLLGD